MKKTIFLFLSIGLFWSFSSSLLAEIRLDEKTVPSADLEQMQTVFQQTMEKLPWQMTEALQKKKIKIKLTKHLLGNLRGRYNSLTSNIEIAIPLSGDYQEVMAPLIHELGHAYYRHYPLSYQQREELKDLTYFNQIGLSFFKKRKQTNTNKKNRLPDDGERENVEEAFCYNLQFFLLDKEYQLRRPSLYRFFSKLWHEKPYAEEMKGQEVNYEFPLDSGSYSKLVPDFVKVSPEDLYQVHFLLAMRGHTLDSKMGHSMLRLVFCNPKRKIKDEKCLTEDRKFHIVVSFGVDMESDPVWKESLKGILGLYGGVPIFDTFPFFVDRYTRELNRELLSLPLEIVKTDDEKKYFLDRLLELRYMYNSRYFYLFNNCAHETRNFLQQSLINQDDQESMRDIFSIRPYALLNKLYKHGLILEENWQKRFIHSYTEPRLYIKRYQEKLNDGYLFYLKNYIAAATLNIGEHLAKEGDNVRLAFDYLIFGSFVDFVNKSNAQDRYKLYQFLKREITSSSRGREELAKEKIKYGEKFSEITEAEYLWKTFLFFEHEAMTILEEQRFRKMQEIEEFKVIISMRKKINYKRLFKHGYGIPLKTDMRKIPAKWQLDYDEQLKKVAHEFDVRWPELKNKIDETQEVSILMELE